MELVLTSKFGVNHSLVISPEEVKKTYLFGISLLDRDGNELQDSVINTFILQSQREIERFLSIKLSRQLISETKTYFVDDWIRWGFMKTTWPIVCPKALSGFYGDQRHINYPKDWLSVRKSNQQDLFNRNLYLVPLTNSVHTQLVSAMFPSNYIGFWSNIRNGVMPNYWQIEYVTGFQQVPLDLVNLLGKMVAIQILPILSDANIKLPGTSSSSLSLDGLSQSVSSFANSTAGIYGARVKQYSEEITKMLPQLRDTYCGIIFDVM